jgi:hypothetical protein
MATACRYFGFLPYFDEHLMIKFRDTGSNSLELIVADFLFSKMMSDSRQRRGFSHALKALSGVISQQVQVDPLDGVTAIKGNYLPIRNRA